jgi:hypothetical protein
MRCTENNKLKNLAQKLAHENHKGPTLNCPKINVRNNHNFLRQKLIINAPLSLNYASQAAIVIKHKCCMISNGQNHHKIIKSLHNLAH